MTLDIDRLVELSERFDLDEGFCTSALEKFAFSSQTFTNAASKIVEAASKNAIAGISE